MLLDPAHHRCLPHLHSHPLKHTGRLQLTSRMQTGGHTFPVNKSAVPWLMYPPFRCNLCAENLFGEYSLVRSLQQALLQPLAHFIRKFPQTQHLG
jgi:hypothetical protein